MATRVKARPAELHASDSYLSALSQAEALRAGRLEDLDLAHLAEELEGLAIATRSAVRSRTRTIIEHLLKLQFSPAAEPRHGWRRTVRVQRSGLRDDLTPTLGRQLEEDLADLYRDGGETAADDLQATTSRRPPTPCRGTAPTAWTRSWATGCPRRLRRNRAGGEDHPGVDP